MVLNELGSRIGEALAKMSSAPVVDEAVLDECLKAICTALLQAPIPAEPSTGRSAEQPHLPCRIARGRPRAKAVQAVHLSCPL